MEAALQRRIQRYGWDKAAMHYETFWHQQLKPAQDKLLELANPKAGEKMIDIACGTGLVSFRAADLLGPSGFVMATDISDNMVKIGTEVAGQKNYQNIRFARMDAEELNIADEEFDISSSALGLMYVPDPARALQEMFRVIMPGGRAVAAVWGQRSRCGWAAVFDIIDKRVASEVCPLFFNLGNNDILKRRFEAAGFSKVHFERINTTLMYQSGDDACGAAFAGGPVALAYNKFDEPMKNEVHQEYLESIRSFKHGYGYAVPGEFVVAIGYRR